MPLHENLQLTILAPYEVVDSSSFPSTKPVASSMWCHALQWWWNGIQSPELW